MAADDVGSAGRRRVVDARRSGIRTRLMPPCMSPTPAIGQTMSNSGSYSSAMRKAPYWIGTWKFSGPRSQPAHTNHILPSSSCVESPLAAVRSGRLADDAGRRPAEAERVVGAVDPVVEAPHEPALLVLEVAVAADADAAVEHLALVGDAVAVRVRQLDHVVRGGLVGEDAVVVERQHHRAAAPACRRRPCACRRCRRRWCLPSALMRLRGSCWLVPSTSGM